MSKEMKAAIDAVMNGKPLEIMTAVKKPPVVTFVVFREAEYKKFMDEEWIDGLDKRGFFYKNYNHVTLDSYNSYVTDGNVIMKRWEDGIQKMSTFNSLEQFKTVYDIV
jgi:hypothetical protein